ncbi:WD40/YVTN/BNR-like repeat-containing protein [Algoriphagus vanfongensis]|uniref:WD40/YVTN/BNR-like repeat-containing protein n=1 Tax=Algoriphagus vanfongensis TaxID=426371 RepID=UPI000414B8AF|nr:YCF48-related protein [Algoriphagus vanfongensis]
MIKKYLLALSFGLALFSCQNSEEESIPDKPSGWEIFETPVKSSLRGLSAVTKDIAWASGSEGTWLRTVDGGKTWTHGIVAGLDTVDFRSIHAFDAETAVVVSAGQPSVIYKTEDGGKTWLLKHQEVEEAFLDGITFADEDRGYVIGDPVDGKWMLLQTIDQGTTWTALKTLPDPISGEAAFAASASNLLAVGDELFLGSGGSESNLYISSDRGSTWLKTKSPMNQGESSQGIFSMTSDGKGELIMVGGDYTQPDLVEGNFGLFSLTHQQWVEPTSPPLGYRSGVQYFPRFQWIIAVGTTGTDFSKDGGLSWESFSQETFRAVELSHSGGSMWASGPDGKVAKLIF